MKKLFLQIDPVRRKKILFWVGGIIVFLLIINVGINYWIRAKLPAIIEEKNDTAYQFKFDELKFSLFSSSISIRNIRIHPKENYDKPIPVNLAAKIDEIKIVGVNFVKLLTEKNLSAYSLKINQPEITYRKPEKRDTVLHQSELGNVIHISNFEINDGKFNIIDANREKLAHLTGIHVEISGVNLSRRTLEKDIPFLYKTFEIECDSIFFQVNPSQELKAHSLKANNHLFALKNFRIESNGKLNSSVRNLPDIKAPNLSFTGLDWGYDEKDEFYFTANLLKFDSINVHLKENPANPERTKDSVGYIIPFRLDIQKISMDDSKLKIGNSMDIENINIQIDKVKNEANQKLSIESILLKNPVVTAYSQNKESSAKTTEKIGFKDFIDIKNFQIQNGQFQINQLKDNRNLLKINQIYFSLNNIKMTPDTYLEQIPVTYENLKLSAKSLDYDPDPIYSLKTKEILFENGDFILNQFEMKPKISRAQFVRQLEKEKDLYTISAAKIQVTDLDWGFSGKDLFVKSPQIEIDEADANIYRSKVPTDDPKKKLLYSKMLRDLPFILEVKRLDLKNSKLVYEEETENSAGAGKLTFANFNAKIDHIHSGYKKSSLPDVRADIKTNFMNDSRLVAVWTFNPMNRAEKFNIKGSIFSFDAKKMTPFVKPYLHATVEGDMKEVRFNFTGNDINAAGDFGIKYDDLKVTLYNKDTGKVRKVLSTVGNFLVKSNTRDRYHEVRLETVTRNQDRSFFNFFWNCVQQGLKQTVLVI